MAIVTGNLDRAGGSMFSRTATERVRGDDPVGRGFRTGRWRNPTSSCPDSERMNEALASLDAMVSVDIYVNETTRHADVILPPPSSLEKSHYDLALYRFGVRNVANWSAAAFESEDLPRRRYWPGSPSSPSGRDLMPTRPSSTARSSGVVVRRGRCEHSPVAGRDVDELLDLVDGDTPSDRILDILLRTGPYGDGFGSDPDGLSLAKLRAQPSRNRSGPARTRLPALLSTPSGTIELFGGPFADELDRLAARLSDDPPDLVLVGRRHLRSNNSWMHNVEVLVKGRPRCTLHVHPEDATRFGMSDGGRARIRSRVGEVIAPVEVSETMRPGVVSLPHGWGHDRPGIGWRSPRGMPA